MQKPQFYWHLSEKKGSNFPTRALINSTYDKFSNWNRSSPSRKEWWRWSAPPVHSVLDPADSYSTSVPEPGTWSPETVPLPWSCCGDHSPISEKNDNISPIVRFFQLNFFPHVLKLTQVLTFTDWIFSEPTEKSKSYTHGVSEKQFVIWRNLSVWLANVWSATYAGSWSGWSCRKRWLSNPSRWKCSR